MKKLLLLISAITLSAVSVFSGNAIAQQATSLDDLLSQLAQGKIAQSKQNQDREAEFNAKKSQQTQLLNQARQQRDQAINLSTQLEKNFQDNDVTLGNNTDALNKRMGELKELFGVLQQVAGDTRSKFQTSVISAQIPGRGQFLDEFAQSMGSSSKLASIEEIERLWFELQREMTQSGKVHKFSREIVLANGEKSQADVVRVGGFNLVSQGKYLEYIDETASVAQLMRQPSSRYLSSANALTSSTNQVVPFALDPTGGSILGLLVQAPDLQERVEQGGAVGYVILAIGLIGLLIAIERFITLFFIGSKVNRQLKSDQASNDNPLGRVMLVQDKNPLDNVETLELKLSESILKEVPVLTTRLTFIKIISVVAPLIGLLGTVTGMINTFQAITLFGTGDPKLMAGGISQALVTTVLGLVVAIPMVFISTLLNTRSRGIINILQQQSAGILAERSESSEKPLTSKQGA
ncbi:MULTISPECIES: MotA/TolQ/ExbB proton channel family protein [unclassified Colwellia]|uniref:MotA/TolQ/ExbB proton channel family protein n=1 Tax=unclassified Colwellia TaxID=196834 RepID=UPI0015F6CFDB|nr:MULTISPECIES: MotA/TolQ/ExbB proton channel family protein [unclassified Colwellia]MBA6362893.1 MotA/TolQ/ExbB proton channel family protein [Colwellia sp. BRX8-8]MBA6350213.1 MotA/TolQ/ExbB proton channel family protein [Colwellia sp. BRX8-9]MBA6353986.1 MotA/TolQ/ExbB proton channel family protein [Colwellia sp. BRX9-1]MBA6357256.1 MotA/TolQ/ExbB proton channel family protein [Colwellia sp. BRX8-3]MBA6361044.1 MotA/TolQ/ExbB proton channel family protein [Colwellia sp. BRX8-6]